MAGELHSQGGEAASPRPWDEFFFSREGTSMRQQSGVQSAASSWEVHQERVDVEQHHDGGSSRFAEHDYPSSATRGSLETSALEPHKQEWWTGTLESPDNAADAGSSTWRRSLAHLLSGRDAVGRDGLLDLPSPPQSGSPIRDGASSADTTGGRTMDSPPTARKLDYETSPLAAAEQDGLKPYRSFCHLQALSTSPNPRATSGQSFEERLPAPYTPSHALHAMDPSPLDAGGRYAPSRGGENREGGSGAVDAKAWMGATREVREVPALRYDSPLDAQTAGEQGGMWRGQFGRSDSNAESFTAWSQLETGLHPERLQELDNSGPTGSEPEAQGVQAEAQWSSTACSPDGVEKPRPAEVGSTSHSVSSAGKEGQVSLVVPGPRRFDVRSSVPTAYQVTSDGSNSFESPSFSVGSRISTPVSSPVRQALAEDDEEAELGATLKAWTSARKASHRRQRDSCNVSLESGNGKETNNSAASLLALQRAVYGKAEQAQATAAASQWAALDSKRATPDARGSSLAKVPTPSTAVWQPAPMKREPPSAPSRQIDLRASADSTAGSESWGVDVEQEYFIAQLAKHIARKLHMRVSKSPRASDSGAPSTSPGQVSPGYASPSAQQGQPRLGTWDRSGEDANGSDVDLVIDLANFGAKGGEKDRISMSDAKGGGKVRSRRKRGGKGALATKRRAAVGDDKGQSNKYTMRCSPCRKETFTRWVFARELVAYKAVAAAVTPAGDTLYVSIYDGTTCYRIGRETFNSARGWFVYLNAEEAAEKPVPSKAKSVVDRFPRLILKVLVSGCGYQQGSSYSFPVMRPVAVVYPDDVVGKYCQEVPDFHSALQKVEKGNVLQELRKLASAPTPCSATNATNKERSTKTAAAGRKTKPTRRRVDMMDKLQGCLNAVVENARR